ncbi:ABC transporter ATP-binding protein [bacterium]|nr:ABC transporter ATP-binding protein [bacterium]
MGWQWVVRWLIHGCPCHMMWRLVRSFLLQSPPVSTRRTRLYRLFEFVLPYRWHVLVSMGLAVVFGAANTFFLPLTRDLTTEIGNQNFVNFTNQAVNAGLLFLVRVAVQYSQAYLMYLTASYISRDIRVTVFAHLTKLSQAYYRQHTIGDVTTRLSSDAERVREGITSVFWELIPNVLTLIGLFGYLLFLNPLLTLFTLSVFPIMVLAVSKLGEKLRKVSAQSQSHASGVGQMIQEVISNLKLVQAYGAENRENKRFKREINRSIFISRKGVRYRNIIEPCLSYLQFVVMISVIWFGAYQISIGNMSGPSLMSFFAGIFLMIDPVIAMSRVYTNFQQTWVSVDRLFELLETEDEIQDPVSPVSVPVSGHVEFKGVSFSYHPDSPVLTDISFEALPGQVVALVGLSGAGKTTLVNLIPRFYDADQGDILIDGVSIRDIHRDQLRSKMAMVMQEDMMIGGTILENIRYSQFDATIEEVVEAAKKANAWEFIERRKKGVFARVGDRGLRLSGGQRQRISIARAILRNPSILILDEATSSLDVKSERLVQRALDTLMKGRTTFVIAHRLSTIIHADQILVIDNGQLVERGTHASLLALNGRYRQLYELQFKKLDEGPVG